MFFPQKEMTVKTVIKRIGSGEDLRFVPDLPLPPQDFGMCLVFCDGVNYYGYPLPPSTEGKEAICHVVYKSEDSEAMDKFAGKLGKGNEVCKTPEYLAIVKTTVGEQKIADEKAKLTAEALAKGEVVKQEDLDKVKYELPDKDDGYPIFVFLRKDYEDK